MRVLVVDKSAAMRDAIADVLRDHDIAWAARDVAAAQLRAALATTQPFDVVLLDTDPAPPPALVRELVAAGGGVRVILLAGDGGAALTGTLFLDEIGELPLALQAKLLRVLQSQEFRRIGDDQDRRVDVRIITATNRDLDQLVASGTFRQDLYYRINVFPLHLPALRERPDDIALLVHHFVQKYRARLGKPIDGATPAALVRLAAYDF